MSMLCFMPPHIRSAATYCRHTYLNTTWFSMSFLLSSSIFKKAHIKIARKYKSFWHATKYPQKFLQKIPIWGYRFCWFFSTKKLVEIEKIDEFLLSSPIFEEIEVKIISKYKEFLLFTWYPNFFCENSQFWDIAFSNFYDSKFLFSSLHVIFSSSVSLNIYFFWKSLYRLFGTT